MRQFSYITNDRKMTMQEVVLFANDRCNRENVIGQLKSGVNALRMPSDGLISNWAYMVIAALSWNLKAWYGLVTLLPAARRDILRMEFKRFPMNFIRIPCHSMLPQCEGIKLGMTFEEIKKIWGDPEDPQLEQMIKEARGQSLIKRIPYTSRLKKCHLMFDEKGCKVHTCMRNRTPLENFNLLARSKGGGHVWLNISIIALQAGGKPVSVHVVRDVSRLEPVAGLRIMRWRRQ
jgi:hypothetical protein